MRKIILALMCMLLTAGAAMAQKKFTFGPKVGVDLTHFWGSGTKFYESNRVQLNYQVGVFAEQGGIVKEHGIPTGIYKDIYTTNYINVPLMMKFYVTKAVSIDFGPQVGFNVYSKTRGKWEDTKDEYNINDRKKYTNTFDFGLGLGATYNITSDVFVQARYTLGLTKIFKDEDPIKNGNAQIAIGYRF